MRSQKKKKKSSTSGLVCPSSLHFGGFNLTRKVCKCYLNHRACWCVHGGGFLKRKKKTPPPKSPCWQLNAAGMMSLEQLEEKREKQVCVC